MWFSIYMVLFCFRRLKVKFFLMYWGFLYVLFIYLISNVEIEFLKWVLIVMKLGWNRMVFWNFGEFVFRWCLYYLNKGGGNLDINF